jgi:hypothetical protein
MQSSALRALLDGAIDYAGLFPPAGLGMVAAVENYASYRRGPHHWALGRFVLPSTRLAEFEQAAEPLLPRGPSDSAWRVATLIGGDAAGELRAVGEFNCRHAADGAGAVSADVVEGKADSVEAVERLLSLVPSYLQAFVEIPLGRDRAPLLAAIARAGGRAKMRTGGITADAFPAAAELARFIRGCLSADLPFKATAGLHHPLRGDYRLTYDADSVRGTMFGFLNVFLATAFLSGRFDDPEAELLLDERRPEAFRFDDTGVEWRGRRIGLEVIRRIRTRGVVSFGSCSFTEPIGDLESLGLL